MNEYVLTIYVYDKWLNIVMDVILHKIIGACGGELACSTCHLIFDEEIYDTLPEKDDEEDDMLDLAFEVTETWVYFPDFFVCCMDVSFWRKSQSDMYLILLSSRRAVTDHVWDAKCWWQKILMGWR